MPLLTSQNLPVASLARIEVAAAVEIFQLSTTGLAAG